MAMIRNWSGAEIVSTLKINKMNANKLNINNCLQDWKTEHQAVTDGMFYCGDSAINSNSGSLQTLYRFESKVLCNWQQKHADKPIPPGVREQKRQTRNEK